LFYCFHFAFQIIIIIIIIIDMFFLGRIYYSNSDFSYVKFVAHNLYISLRHTFFFVVIINLLPLVHTGIIAMSMIFLHKIIHVPRSNGSLIIAVKPEANKFVTWPPYCGFTFYRKKYLHKICIFSGFLLNGTGVVPT
jgi:hypothetical protein